MKNSYFNEEQQADESITLYCEWIYECSPGDNVI